MNPRRAATVMPSLAAIKADQGPLLESYAIPLGVGVPYRWIVGDTSTTDDLNVLAHQGGTTGRWHRVREAIMGAALTDASVTIQLGGNRWRVLPAATLTVNRILTLGTTCAAAGDMLTVTRLDAGAFTYAVVNGGAGGGTLLTMPVSQRYFGDFYFDGSNWRLMRAGAMA